MKRRHEVLQAPLLSARAAGQIRTDSTTLQQRHDLIDPSHRRENELSAQKWAAYKRMLSAWADTVSF